MDRIIYTAMAGAKQTMDRQAVVNNNLANVSTTGFRAQLSAMRAVPTCLPAPLPAPAAISISPCRATPGWRSWTTAVSKPTAVAAICRWTAPGC